jgi:peptidoglycan/LPS O-acetylase OafA/YrhL
MVWVCFRVICGTVVTAFLIGVLVLYFSPELEKLIDRKYYTLVDIAIWLLAVAVALFDEWLRYRRRLKTVINQQPSKTT